MSPLNKNSRSNNGFTLVEMAISLLILGLIMAPALAAYNLYEKNRKIEQTNVAITEATAAISGFRESYGRLPCPAPFDATPGDADYGYEDCGATAPGIITTNNGGATPDVYIGSLPFRTMNLQERETTDGYNQRLTYAVTANLTDTSTYGATGGGIEIVDEFDNSVITGSGVSGSAHFVVISHGPDGAGAHTYNGNVVLDCAGAPTFDQENCDFLTGAPDATFRAGNVQEDYDDKISYSTFNDVTPWQYQDGDTSNIHLRSADFVVLGKDDPSNSPGAAEALEVRDRGTGTDGDGDFFIQDGRIETDLLCDVTGTDCFSPNLIGGLIADPTDSSNLSTAQPGTPLGPDSSYGYTTITGGLTCKDDTGVRKTMVGIMNERPVCSSVITMRCPAGEELTSINSGKLRCDTSGAACTTDEPAITSCGESITIDQDLLDGDYALEYSGQCYFIDAWNPTAADLSSVANIQAYVDTLNNSPRTNSPCGADETDFLVRDAFECVDGSYIETSETVAESEYAQELRSGGWPTDFLSNSGYRRAEDISHSRHEDYDPAFPYTPADANTGPDSGYHDCWCREDYRVRTDSCGGGNTGTEVFVDKLNCPQTTQNWTTIYTNTTSFCSCSPDTWSESEACYEYFNIDADRVDGTVTVDYERTCSPTTITETGADTSACTCPNRAPQLQIDNCPAGTTNSFTYNSVNYTDVDRIRERTWNCPTGVGGPVDSAAQAGSWNSYVTVSDETCVCDPSAKSTEYEACPPEKDGPGITYETQLNCSTGNYERTGVIISGFCNACSWKKPGASGNAESAPRGAPITNPCTCGDVSACRDSIGGGLYMVWDGCTCTSN